MSLAPNTSQNYAEQNPFYAATVFKELAAYEYSRCCSKEVLKVGHVVGILSACPTTILKSQH